MSEFKFACPACGQHITCDSAKSGTTLDCPTCFQKLIVPQAPTGNASKLILSAALVHARPSPQVETTAEAAVPLSAPSRKLPVVIVSVLLLVAGAVFAFRGKIFKSPRRLDALDPSSRPTANDTAWKLDLTGVAIPDRPLAGRISGLEFNSPQAILEGGTLVLRQGQRGGQRGTSQLRLTISFAVQKGEELAGRDIEIGAKHNQPPKVLLVRRDDPGERPQRNTPSGYVLRLQFGEVNNGRLPGKIYFCAFDGAKSWVVGTFEAEIRKAPPPRTRPSRPSRR